MPDATQLLRHGFMQEIASLRLRSASPGVAGQSQVAIADFAVEGNRGLDAHWFTLVLVPAPESIHFATRILCHDRGLDELERSNPDAERQVIELDDQAVRLESEAFLERYTLSADHDQDNVRTWQLFDPAPHRLADEAGAGGLLLRAPGRRAVLLRQGSHRRGREARRALRGRGPGLRAG